jgi:hypothetical protein
LRYREPRLPGICTIKGALIDYTLITDFSIAVLESVKSAHIDRTLGPKALPARKSASYASINLMSYLLMIKV